jgi:hypothetical protein
VGAAIGELKSGVVETEEHESRTEELRRRTDRSFEEYRPVPQSDSTGC